jgi:tetratricopeptide (TPR) repeat protein
MMKDADRTATTRRRARTVFREAYRAQQRGEIDTALRLYRESIRIHATPEAHTFLGWAHSFRREYETAIGCCRAAIALDPDFGNPYNDIGAYLIEMGRWEEAIPWLRAATRARRYRSYHYAHFNLGRVHEHAFDWDLAEASYRMALRFEPSYKPARLAIARIEARRN